MSDAQTVADLMGDLPYRSLEERVAHPRLPEARNVYITEFLKVYGTEPHMTRLLIDSARYFLFTIALVNYAAQDTARPETWATVGYLKQCMHQYTPASVRQVDSLISRLRDLGFLDLVPSEQDGRLRIVKPTEKAMAHDRDWLAAHYAPLAVLYPENDYSLVTSRNAAFQVRHRRQSMEFRPLSWQLFVQLQEVMVFFARPGGYMFLAALFEAAIANPDGQYVAVSYAGVGERFGYSRTHVRQVLTDAEAAGLVRLHSAGGHRVEILPPLWRGHDRSIAVGMHLHDMIYARTAADWPRSARERIRKEQVSLLAP